MHGKLMKWAVTALAMSALVGCGKGEEGEETVDIAARFLVWATDDHGYINVYADDGGSNVGRIATLQPEHGLSLGEVHFAKGKAFVVIRTGVKDEDDAADAPGDGGIAVYDVATQAFEGIVRLSSQTDRPSRIVHTYAEGDEYLWLNNDGPRGDTGEDSVFRFAMGDSNAWTDSDGDGNFDLAYDEIVLPNGHKKSAFATPPSAEEPDLPAVPALFASHNLTDESVSIIDNDPANSGTTFLTVLDPNGAGGNRSVDMKSSSMVPDGAGGERPAKNTPHGLGFSKVSGHFYVGITAGEDFAMAIIDATDLNLTMTPIYAGDPTVGATAVARIPAGGYIKVSHDGKYVYMVGYKMTGMGDEMTGTGYLSVVKAETDEVVDIIDLGDVKASKVLIAEMEPHGEPEAGGHAHANVKVMVASTAGGGVGNVVKVIDIDTHTGTRHEENGVKAEPTTVTIGMGGDHRNGAVSPDGTRAFFPNGGHCGETCEGIVVIDSMTNGQIATLAMEGHEAHGIGVLDASGMNLGTFTITKPKTVNYGGPAAGGHGAHNH